MKNQVLKEIKELKLAIGQLIGTADLATKDRFSKEALNQAAKTFRKLSIERGEWINDGDIHRIIRGAPYRAGNFIRNEFGFRNYFKRGQTYYFYKKDLVALGSELKKRNIDLKRYMELKEDQGKFEKYLAAASQNRGKKQKGKTFQVADGLKDIATSPIPMPSAETVRDDLKNLKEEFFRYKLSEYIDIYGDNHAMMKTIYFFEKYIDPQLKRRCRKWCDNFNYANHALEEITKKKEKFIPVAEEDMIQL